ncbi:hypothetical protein [Streptomyces sp. NPDC051677]|uniref:hypothetical protein n=1 Tax=Streptomyces sp. NPDC051677 TaxID=3365669 RepID=UPI0037D1EB1C
MRRTTFHRTTAVAALTAAAFLLAGCGAENHDRSVSTAPTTTPPTAADQDCTASKPTPAQLTAADDGRTVCLNVGGQVRLDLDGTEARPWTAVPAAGDVLKATNAGIGTPPGDALAAYDAVAAGTARLTATRPLCAAPTGQGQVSCKGVKEWSVTVTVKR